MGFVRSTSSAASATSKQGFSFFGIPTLDRALTDGHAGLIRTAFIITEPFYSDVVTSGSLWSLSGSQQILRCTISRQHFDAPTATTIYYYSPLSKPSEEGERGHVSVPFEFSGKQPSMPSKSLEPADDAKMNIAWRYARINPKTASSPKEDDDSFGEGFACDLGQSRTASLTVFSDPAPLLAALRSSASKSPSMVILENLFEEQDDDVIVEILSHQQQHPCIVTMPAHRAFTTKTGTRILSSIDCAIQVIPFDTAMRDSISGASTSAATHSTGGGFNGLLRLVKPAFHGLAPIVLPSAMGFGVRRRRHFYLATFHLPPAISSDSKEDASDGRQQQSSLGCQSSSSTLDARMVSLSQDF